MTQALFSGSSYSRVRHCPASAILPHVGREVGDGGVGDVLHEHMRLRVDRGIDAAVDALPALCRRLGLHEKEASIATARAMGFEYTPPAGTQCEVSLALFADGHVERVKGGRGSYDLPAGAFFAMTVDAIWAEPMPLQPSKPQDSELTWKCPGTSVLWVVDWKGGQEQYVEQIEFNAQLQAAALLAGRWTGAAAVLPSICFIRKGAGEWDTPVDEEGHPRPLGPADLDGIFLELQATYQAAVTARSNLEAEVPVALNEGHWCTFCPAQSRCPAKTAMVASAVEGRLVKSSEMVAGLTHSQVLRLATALPQLESFCRRAKAYLSNVVAETGEPIELGDGLVWGPHPYPKKRLDPKIGVEILAQEIGHDAAEAALSVDLTQEAVKRAVQAAHEAAGISRKVDPTVRRVMAKLQEAGGITRYEETRLSAYRPRAVTEDGDVAGDDE